MDFNELRICRQCQDVYRKTKDYSHNICYDCMLFGVYRKDNIRFKWLLILASTGLVTLGMIELVRWLVL